MNKLFIDDNKQSVPVAELGLILGKSQVVFGNLERDLILRTAGNVKVQVGNKFFDFPLNVNADNTSTTIGGNTKVYMTQFDFNNSTFPSNGTLVYVVESQSFYIAVNGSYVLLSKVNPSNNGGTMYLSYSGSQNLSGGNKYQLFLNAGYIIDELNDVLSLDSSETYPNQVILSLSEGKHFRLIDANNPNLVGSWKELYLSTTGGSIEGSTIINGDLRIIGDYPFENVTTTSTDFKGYSLGNNFNEGAAWWYNGTTVNFSNQSIGGVTRFVTRGANSNFTPLQISGPNVGIGNIDYGYNFTVSGSSYVTGNLTVGGSVSSKNFRAGEDGIGFSIYKDSTDLWVLEVDSLITRFSSTLVLGEVPEYSGQTAAKDDGLLEGDMYRTGEVLKIVY